MTELATAAGSSTVPGHLTCMEVFNVRFIPMHMCKVQSHIHQPQVAVSETVASGEEKDEKGEKEEKVGQDVCMSSPPPCVPGRRSACTFSLRLIGMSRRMQAKLKTTIPTPTTSMG